MVAWKGIRYAHAPRFGLPTLAPLPQADMRCDTYGPASAQPKMPGAVASASDDPFFLNVWSPGADGARRPVLVWIHGGAFALGAGSQYDGAELARRGDIVVVTINYRLGLLGFTDLSALGVPNNRGLHDQLAALQWVRAHIALFGGDPERVTLAGESAGAMSVALLMIANTPQRLFQGAIVQSGALNLVHDQATAARQGQRFLAQLPAHQRTLAALEALPMTTLQAAAVRMADHSIGIMPAAPVYDGQLLPSTYQAACEVETPPIPLIIGAMGEEIRLFWRAGVRDKIASRRAEVIGPAAAQLGAEHARRIDAAYSHTRAGEQQLATDANFAMPGQHFAERHAKWGHAAWVYRFDLGGLVFGAAHAVDLTYLWPWRGPAFAALRGGPLLGGRLRLARRMQDAWIAFVRDGDPGAAWPRYTVPERAMLIMDRTDRIEHDPERNRREAWDGADIALGAQAP